MPCHPGDHVHRQVGTGTTQDPLIMWLVGPPRSQTRTLGNEQVARDLGRVGFTHIWIRSCDHRTTRISVATRRGRRRQVVHTDNHITVYCGRSSNADRQGDVFLLVERNGTWRIMRDSERTSTQNGRQGHGIELYPYP
ncbi:hypothetical protein FOCG_12629 [Fusarium oxysporum f. sp. radicis-lycopersici 26381]|nr:hypothetical protein FOCG_12629 [Fusarium oxysporum f. sp. radicis-lycopersici 26381]KAK2687010.1 hypothetical protein QWA68_013618 [Fusarium oxysporum]